MKTARRTTMTALAMLAGIVLAAGSAWAGNLTPPGAPGSTMKTLTEVHDRAQAAQTAAETAGTKADAAKTAAEAAEPRTAITGAVTITQPGSYYLAGNITGKITIQANNVTLDLMGFRVAPASGGAIEIPNGFGENTHSGRTMPAFHWPTLSLGLLVFESMCPPASCTAASPPLLNGT